MQRIKKFVEKLLSTPSSDFLTTSPLWRSVIFRCTGKDPVGDCPKCGKKNNAVELFRQLGCAQENYHSAMNMMHEGKQDGPSAPHETTWLGGTGSHGHSMAADHF